MRNPTTASIVRGHYLGHAAFVLQFGETTVLTDYGKPNAWVEWGWDSPVYGVGDLVPDVATYSHTHHDDHFDAGRLPAAVPTVLKGDGPIEIDDLTIAPIAMHESELDTEDSTAYLFSFRGARVLHLGDCQADIICSGDPKHGAWLRRALPRRCDLVLMPIECQQRFFPQINVFVRRLEPVRLVPMHFWSAETLRTFLAHARRQHDPSGHPYRIDEARGPQLKFSIGKASDGVRVIPLERAPFRDWTTCSDR
jgi:L-ascorbate metabolism protein UlaG (beta-lactamase superfamily)